MRSGARPPLAVATRLGRPHAQKHALGNRTNVALRARTVAFVFVGTAPRITNGVGAYMRTRTRPSLSTTARTWISWAQKHAPDIMANIARRARMDVTASCCECIQARGRHTARAHLEFAGAVRRPRSRTFANVALRARAAVLIEHTPRANNGVGMCARPIARPPPSATTCSWSSWMQKRVPKNLTNFAMRAGRPCRRNADASKRAANTLRNHM